MSQPTRRRTQGRCERRAGAQPSQQAPCGRAAAVVPTHRPTLTLSKRHRVPHHCVRPRLPPQGVSTPACTRPSPGVRSRVCEGACGCGFEMWEDRDRRQTSHTRTGRRRVVWGGWNWNLPARFLFAGSERGVRKEHGKESEGRTRVEIWWRVRCPAGASTTMTARRAPPTRVTYYPRASRPRIPRSAQPPSWNTQYHGPRTRPCLGTEYGAIASSRRPVTRETPTPASETHTRPPWVCSLQQMHVRDGPAAGPPRVPTRWSRPTGVRGRTN